MNWFIVKKKTNQVITDKIFSDVNLYIKIPNINRGYQKSGPTGQS